MENRHMGAKLFCADRRTEMTKLRVAFRNVAKAPKLRRLAILAVCRLKPPYGYHTTTAKPQRNTNTHRPRAIQPMK